MRTPFTIRRVIAGVLVWGFVAFAWFSFAPPALGGETNYVTTDGISMEPHFHGGDLVLVRAQKSYHVGEIVAYRSKALDAVVLHRIIGLDGSRYIFKGDNNNFVDIEHPTRSQLVGALWLHIPGKYVGILAVLREPPVLGGLVALSALLLFGGAFTAGRQSRRRRRRNEDAQAAPANSKRPSLSSFAGDVVLVGGALLLASAAVAAVAFTRPTTGRGTKSIPFTQSGAFSYSASTASGPAYPAGRVTTGDPVFMKLVNEVNVRFAYRFSSEAPHHLAGTASFLAKVSSTSGWNETVVLEPPTRFSGDRAILAGTLNLAPLLAVLNKLEQTTQVDGSYTLMLVPHVAVAGAIGSVAAHTRFSEPLSFSLDQLELQPVLSSGASNATYAAAASASPLNPTSSSSVTAMVQQPRAVAFGPAHLRVSSIRGIGIDGLVLGACVLIAGLVLLIRASSRRGDLAADILDRYRRSLIRVARVPRPTASDLVELEDMETLVRIAERYDRMILHERVMGADTFCVPEDGVLYRYSIPSEVLLRYPPEVLQFLASRIEEPGGSDATVRKAPEKTGDVRWGPWSAPATRRQPAA